MSPLRMFQHQLKHAFTVSGNSTAIFPKFRNGSELNQIWTNLIDNSNCQRMALSRMEEVLGSDQRANLNSSPWKLSPMGGHPAEIQGPHFQSILYDQPVGEGTGPGLDIVQRIVRAHPRLNPAGVETGPHRISGRLRESALPLEHSQSRTKEHQAGHQTADRNGVHQDKDS